MHVNIVWLCVSDADETHTDHIDAAEDRAAAGIPAPQRSFDAPPSAYDEYVLLCVCIRVFLCVTCLTSDDDFQTQ